ncbi:MAG: ATP-grasp domain-containing protein [FCB group bacterium]|jgi:biotin carboxylase|nr:ATP-grasp domain-containing protein [FCB group bacterium]
MTKRILVVGGGTGRAGVIEKARALGADPVLVDDRSAAPPPSQECMLVEDIANPALLVEAGQALGVDGMFALEERAVDAVVYAAHELGLPGISPEVAFRVRNKLALREALRAHGMPVPAFRGVHTVEEGETAALELGLPVVVRPADAGLGGGVQCVEYVEDISLAFVQARRLSSSGTVVVETVVEGEAFNVDGQVFGGEYRLGGISGKERSEPPYRYDTGLYMPADIDAPLRYAIVDETLRALQAVGFTDGTLRVEVVVCGDGPRIMEMAIPTIGGCVAVDLVAHAYGRDYLADSLRIALGETPREQPRFERGCALYWIPSRSGVVNQVLGAGQARAMPGVEEVELRVQPGDVLGHVVDCVTRDRIGRVLATADTAEEAVCIAKAARDTVHVVTRPTYEQT